MRLFEADALRQDFEPAAGAIVVSPENAREQLATFIKRAKKQLVIWDPKVTDPQMIRLIQQRVKAGVDVRIIGKVARLAATCAPRRCRGVCTCGPWCATATRPSSAARASGALELDARREVGLFAKDPKVVKRIADLFEGDWAKTELGQKELKAGEKAQRLKAGEKVQKAQELAAS